MTTQPYTSRFFCTIREGARRSAREIVPLMIELARPRNVLDVGCGEGTWLSVFKECGVQDVWGVDGEYIDKTALEMPEERFIAYDLRTPLRLPGNFDFVVSLEVAEHLPIECAETFVESLVSHAPLVLFSAAIPYQGGVDHINEQWQDYWAAHFAKQNYQAVDCVRHKVWQNPNVEWWYAQNTLLYVREDYLQAGDVRLDERLRREYENTHPSQLRLVHPRQHLHNTGASGRVSNLVESTASLIPPGMTLVLLDQDCLGRETFADRDVLPFLIPEDCEWRRPPDDQTAIRVIESLRQSGADFVVFGRPFGWWSYSYPELERYLRTTYRRVSDENGCIVFNLRA